MTTETATCPQCGGTISILAKVCSYCGSSFLRDEKTEKAASTIEAKLAKSDETIRKIRDQKIPLSYKTIDGYKATFGRTFLWLFLLPFMVIWKAVKVIGSISRAAAGTEKDISDRVSTAEIELEPLKRGYENDPVVSGRCKKLDADLSEALKVWHGRKTKSVAIIVIGTVAVTAGLFLFFFLIQ